MVAAIVIAILVVNVVGYQLTLSRHFRSVERMEIHKRLRDVTR